jgi:cytochrome c oxidase cbb3-type subunit 3
MQRKHKTALAAIFGITLMLGSQLSAQPPAGASGGRGGRAGRGGRGVVAAGASGAPGRAGGGGAAYPSRPSADPAVAMRGKAIWDAGCASCHAADMRGTPGGINLVRNQMVLDDQNGELIGKFLQNPHDSGKVAKTALSTDQIHDLSIYMHTFMNYRTIVMPGDADSAILAFGKPAAGEVYFKAHCASCHSVTGDLKGIGTKYSEPKTLQNTIVAGGAGGGRGGRGGGGAADDGGDTPAGRRTVTAIVTMPDGHKYEGRLISHDDFLITIAEADGTQRTIRRNGDVPKLEIHDPMKIHRDMLLTLTDDDIHNLTAYLVGVK